MFPIIDENTSIQTWLHPAGGLFSFSMNLESLRAALAASPENVPLLLMVGQVLEDEFELEDRKKETIQLMKEKVEGFNLHDEFTINTNIEFGKYNFKKGVYPLMGLNKNSFYFEDKHYIDTYPKRFKMFLRNSEIITAIKMEKVKAKTFLKSRKDKYGSIDRELPSEIKIVIEKLGEGEGELIGRITEINIFEDKEHNTLFATFKGNASD